MNSEKVYCNHKNFRNVFKFVAAVIVVVIVCLVWDKYEKLKQEYFSPCATKEQHRYNPG